MRSPTEHRSWTTQWFGCTSTRASKLVESVDPTYPEAKRTSGEAVTVTLTLSIDRTGQVADVAVAESAGAEFDEAAVNAARNLRFEPAQNGEAVPAKIRYVFEFKLAPASEPAAPPPAAPVAAATATVTTEPAAPSATDAAQDEALDVEVQGEKPPREPTRHAIAAEGISRIPGTNGDAIRGHRQHAGRGSPAGRCDGMLIVRGSSPNDTAVFVDGTDIPMVYHFGGLSSVIPTEMLEKLDFYPGNFGPQYGRAMGGVVDVGGAFAAQRSPRWSVAIRSGRRSPTRRRPPSARAPASCSPVGARGSTPGSEPR